MTVRELRAALDAASADAAVLVVDPDGEPFPIALAAVWSADEFEYTQLPGTPGDFVISLGDEDLSR